MLKKLFHTYNSILLILYLYPGSILGFLLYKDFYKQPQLTSDFLSISISSNHFYAFLLLAFLGFCTFKYNKFFLISRNSKGWWQKLEINKLKWELSKAKQQLGDYIYNSNINDTYDFSNDSEFHKLIDKIKEIENFLNNKQK